MGKKSTYKKLRKIAEQMPVIMKPSCEVHMVKGTELIQQGHTENEQGEINPYQTYLQKMPVLIAVNHKRAIKKAFKKHGIEGIQAYAEAVDDYQKENQ
jgi:hypothetical protein